MNGNQMTQRTDQWQDPSGPTQGSQSLDWFLLSGLNYGIVAS